MRYIRLVAATVEENIFCCLLLSGVKFGLYCPIHGNLIINSIFNFTYH